MKQETLTNGMFLSQDLSKLLMLSEFPVTHITYIVCFIKLA